jgi:predicted dehydrogenase
VSFILAATPAGWGYLQDGPKEAGLMKSVSRRDFIKHSGAAVAAAGVLSTARRSVWAQVAGANDRIRVAVVGVRKKGIEHIKAFRGIPGVQLAALCDADTQFLDLEVKKLQDAHEAVETYVDIRRLLENRNIDAVILSIPDHWHALATVWACQAGKHVYVEKPTSYSIWEGRKMVEAARKYNRIVGVGSQERSDTGLLAFAKHLKEGHLGKVRFARAISYGLRESIGKVNGPQPIPPTCDYNLFQGPASLTPLMRQNLHYDWHWCWPTGTGEIGNLGGHVLDDCRWIIGIDDLPRRVISLGGRFGYDDDGETPNTQIAYYDYAEVPVIYEVRGLPAKKGVNWEDQYRGIRFGMVIQCENGYFAGGRGGGWTYDNNDKRLNQFPGDGGGTHQANFIEAVRSGKRETLHADIREGHLSAALCHMANISYRLGRRQSVEETKGTVADRELLKECFERLLPHLEANGIDLAKTPLTVGPTLSWNNQAEKFEGEHGDWANMLLSRTYREPFVVPEQV